MRRYIRIMIAVEHPIMAEGLRTIIGNTSDLEVVSVVANGDEAIWGVASLRPDILLIDIDLLYETYFQILCRFHFDYPDLKTFLLAPSLHERDVLTMIRTGAQGCILYSSTKPNMLRTLRSVFPQYAAAESQQAETVTNISDLTKREIEVLKLVAQGHSNQLISNILMISERTVRTHVSNILDKLQLENRTQASLYAVRNGLLSIETTSADSKFPRSSHVQALRLE